MKRHLGRLLEIRALLEDISRLDLEKKHRGVLAMESAASHQRRLALETRAEAMRVTGEGQGYWQLMINDAGIFDRKETKLRALAAAGKPFVEQARDALLARRLERRRVEVLIEASQRLEKQSRLRREQQRADEWYQQSKRLRQKSKVRTLSG